MELMERFAARARDIGGTVIFAEGDEDRTIVAASRLVRDGVCRAVLVETQAGQVRESAARNGVTPDGMQVVAPSVDLLDGGVYRDFVRVRTEKGSSAEDARAMALEPLTFSALFVKSGRAAACVAGARSATADVLRAAIHGIGTAPDTKLISSFFLMIPPKGHPIVSHPLLFADCAVNPEPGAYLLKEIAQASVRSFGQLFPESVPRVAFLSFSTKGSANHSSLGKIREAVSMLREDNPGGAFIADGEFQLDAALVPAVAERKAPGSPVHGDANILVFPYLNAGNIGYKLAERLAGFAAIGPIIQGLARPMNDLSRGCSVEDIYNVSVIALLRGR
jgi:phosphate acetyltransferase